MNRRILYFSCGYTPHDYRFLTSMAACGLDVFFLRLFPDLPAMESRPLPAGVQRVPWQDGVMTLACVDEPSDLLALKLPLRHLLAEIRPDVVHAGPVPTCGYLAAQAGANPLLTMSWGSDLLVDAEKNEAWREATRVALMCSSAFQCDCLAVREKAFSLCSMPSTQIVQFPWGVDLTRFRSGGATAGVRESQSWQAAKVVFCNRAWEEIYGIETVLRAFYDASQRRDDLRLLLLSHGAKAAWVYDFVQLHKLETKVLCPGRVSNTQLPLYLREADVYLSCSQSDGSSISLIEALATGLPTVISDIPGNREWVTPHVGSYLVAPGDADGFARALLFAANLQEDEIGYVGREHRRIAEERADWSVNFQKLIATYERVCHVC